MADQHDLAEDVLTRDEFECCPIDLHAIDLLYIAGDLTTHSDPKVKLISYRISDIAQAILTQTGAISPEH